LKALDVDGNITSKWIIKKYFGSVWSGGGVRLSQDRDKWLILANNQLDAQFLYLIISLLQSSTCFEQRRAHHQEVKFD